MTRADTLTPHDFGLPQGTKQEVEASADGVKAALKARRPFDAIALSDQHLVLSGGSGPAFFLRGRVEERLGRFKHAENSYQQAHRINPAHNGSISSIERILGIAADFDGVRALIRNGNAAEALTRLKSMTTTNASVKHLWTAVALLRLGRNAGAATAIEAFLDEQPSHRLGKAVEQVVKTRLENRAPAAQMADAGSVDTKKVRTPVRSSADRKREVSEEIDTLLARLDAAGGAGAEDEAIIARFRQLGDVLSPMPWHEEANLAKAAHFAFASDPDRAGANYDAEMIEKSVEFGYVTWPRRIRSHIRGRSVLDIGCGFGAFGNAFLLSGAASYTGVDPSMPLDSSVVKNKRRRERADLGSTPREIMARCPDIHLVSGMFEDFQGKQSFDVVVLHNVTEHLMQLEQVFSGISRLMHPDSTLIYHHHNYFCWNGHHQKPHHPTRYNPENSEHRWFADWQHVLKADEYPADHYLRTNLNHVRLDDIRKITEGLFEITEWQEVDSPAEIKERLTEERLETITAFDPSLTRRDLLVNAVYCVAKPKGN